MPDPSFFDKLCLLEIIFYFPLNDILTMQDNQFHIFGNCLNKY